MIDRTRNEDPRYPYGMEMPGRSLNVVWSGRFSLFDLDIDKV